MSRYDCLSITMTTETRTGMSIAVTVQIDTIEDSEDDKEERVMNAVNWLIRKWSQRTAYATTELDDNESDGEDDES
jgi:hypothetical protein